MDEKLPVAGTEVELSVGQLADRSGVTVRALHHYEDIGLLVPSGRTPTGHRRYGSAEVDRLQRIVALQSLGLSLADVAHVLASDEGTTAEVARRQLDDVRDRIGELRAVERRLARLIAPDTTAPDTTDPDTTAPDATADTLELTAMTIRLDRITTRTGDDGTTALADGSRVAKVDARVEAIGAVDELDAIVGLARDATRDSPVGGVLDEVQQQLFDLGADLATPAAPSTGRLVDEQAVVKLDELVADATGQLEPLRTFVLPGGPNGAGALHVARTVCRRAERRVWAIDGDTGSAAAYLNRLSDLLFVLARVTADGDERLWRRPVGRRSGGRA